MKSRTLIALATLAAMCAVGGWVMSDDKAPAAAGGHSAQEMDAMQKAGEVGPHHKMLAQLEGKFKAVNTMKMAPDQPAMTSPGSSENKMIFGGRYLVCSYHGDFMGTPFDGEGIMGYDNTTGKHFSTWIDSGSTGMTYSTGTCSNDCKTITFEGEMPNPMMGGQMCKYKMVYNIKSADAYDFAMWTPGPDGNLFEMMTISYTREQ